MEFKGTKGTWKSVQGDDGYDILWVEKSDRFAKAYIAKEINQGKDEGEADAKLIAAAPELLEALQGVIRLKDLIIYPSNEVHAEDEGEAEEILLMFSAIESAIKKALNP